jgi:ring-1,2-phenylacetyl-CoA epoxidase subunit PaaD
VVSEVATQVRIARLRGRVVAARARVDADDVRAALADVPDPELPMLSVVDLGIIHRVDVAARLGAFGRPVEVVATFQVPWTSERITEAGRRALEAAGIAPLGEPFSDGLIALEPRVPCPHCGSRDTVLENAFGPTQCRTIRFCRGCRQPFEAIKPV